MITTWTKCKRYSKHSWADFVRLLRINQAPLLVVATFLLVTQASQQLPEFILGFAQTPITRARIYLSALLLLGFLLTLAAYIFEFISIAEDECPLDLIWRRPLLLSSFMSAIITIPAGSIVVAIWSARAGLDKQTQYLAPALSWMGFGYLALTLIAVWSISIFCFFTLRTDSTFRIQSARARFFALHNMAPIFAVSIWAVIFFTVWIDPQRPKVGNTVSFVFIFFIVWTILICRLFIATNRRSLPVFTICISAYTLLCVLDWNDHHFITQRTVTIADDADPSAALNKDKAFEVAARSWFENRHSSRPVYVIAAQGGGTYAAYHAASVIAEMIGPGHQLGRDIFAVSGVSGGSVGSAIAVAAAHAVHSARQVVPANKQEACAGEWSNHDTLQQILDQVFREDFASPIVVGTLFVDSIFEVIPSKFLWQLDRANLIERAFVDRSQRVLKELLRAEPPASLLDTDFFDYQRESTFHPELFFNVVSSATGGREYVARFELPEVESDDPDKVQKSSINRALTDLRLNLIQAAVLSARYPYVTPPASIMSSTPAGRESVIRIVDGGYFENSAVATALDIVRALKPYANGAPIRLIVLGGSDSQKNPTNHLNELLTPFHTMLQTRVARGEDYIREAETTLGGQNVKKLRVSPPDKTLNVGWYLSSATLTGIKIELMSSIARELDSTAKLCDRPNTFAP
jgi:hypothetical protein